MDISFWRKNKPKNEPMKTDEEIMEEIEEIKKKKKKEEGDKWSKKYEKEKERIRKDVQVVIEGLEILPARCLKATKSGRDSIRVMKLERKHLSNSNYSFKKLSYHYSYDWLRSYSEYVDNSDIMNLISILEGKGFRVFVEMAECYSKETDIDKLVDSPIEWFNPNAYLSIRL